MLNDDWSPLLIEFKVVASGCSDNAGVASEEFSKNQSLPRYPSA